MSLKNLLNRLVSQKSDLLMHQPAQPEMGPGGVPDFVEPLLGWRAWKVWAPLSSSDSYLAFSSVILDTPWTPRRKVTAEHSFDLGAKCCGLLESGCSCGVYAFKDAADAFAYLTKVRDRLLGMSVDVALGTVSLWGRVVDCERGYKAQFAYPHHIYLPATISRFMLKVSSAFGVDVGVYASTCEDEIRLAVSSGCDGQQNTTMLTNMKRSGSLRAKNIPCEVGFYDLQASSAWMRQLPTARSEIPPWVSWSR